MKLPNERSIRAAFSLVELLIVILIISLLLQMLLPAVEMAQEAARRTRCAHQLHQIGLGVHMHVDSIGRYPSGGWGTFWVGDPDRGTGPEQPGSWIYNVLAYVEQAQLRDKGRGLTGSARLEAIAEVCTTPVPIFNCPSRRLPRPYKRSNSNKWMTLDGHTPLPIDEAARSDYAINTGHYLFPEMKGDMPTSYEEIEQPGFEWFDNSGYTGISYGRSEVQPKQIEDGLSNTYLLGEKFLPQVYYHNGGHLADNESMYSGFDDDNGRTGRKPPVRDVGIFDDDTLAASHKHSFGSAHPLVWQMVLCDGSVHALSYGIDPEVHSRLANRSDGEVVTISN